MVIGRGDPIHQEVAASLEIQSQAGRIKMNPITITATKLENEAQTLYNALQQHSSLYARR